MENINNNLSPEQIQAMFNNMLAKMQDNHGSLYQKDSKGHIINNMVNYITFLENDELTKGNIKYNKFLERKEFIRKDKSEEYSDFLESKIKLKMSQVLGFNITGTLFTDAINNVFMDNQYNPVIDYLNSLSWDETPRVETMFVDWLGADDTPLIREMTRKWLVAAVKRVFEPGSKFDNMIVLQGPQGCGKSTLCYRLAHSFYNEHIDIDDPKNYVEILNRSWIVCFDELAGISRKALSSIKAFLSKQDDTTRLAYARNPQTFKRHCIFIGSTNEDNFLRDYTASIERRFWVVECKLDNMTNKVGSGFTNEVIDQLWAEAVYLYKQDPNQFLDLSADGIQTLTKEQEKFKISNDDEMLDVVRDVFETEFILNSKGEFDNVDDFYNQYCRLSTKQGCSQKFTRIPTNYIKYLMTKKFHDTRTPKYISSTLKDILTYKKAVYQKASVWCYSRIDEIDKRIFNGKQDDIKISGSGIF